MVSLKKATFIDVKRAIEAHIAVLHPEYELRMSIAE